MTNWPGTPSPDILVFSYISLFFMNIWLLKNNKNIVYERNYLQNINRSFGFTSIIVNLYNSC
jgi:hypothetical protein